MKNGEAYKYEFKYIDGNVEIHLHHPADCTAEELVDAFTRFISAAGFFKSTIRDALEIVLENLNEELGIEEKKDEFRHNTKVNDDNTHLDDPAERSPDRRNRHFY